MNEQTTNQDQRDPEHDVGHDGEPADGGLGPPDGAEPLLEATDPISAQVAGGSLLQTMAASNGLMLLNAASSQQANNIVQIAASVQGFVEAVRAGRSPTPAVSAIGPFAGPGGDRPAPPAPPEPGAAP